MIHKKDIFNIIVKQNMMRRNKEEKKDGEMEREGEERRERGSREVRKACCFLSIILVPSLGRSWVYCTRQLRFDRYIILYHQSYKLNVIFAYLSRI